MAIQWDIVATISSPVIALFVGIFLTYVFERRPRLITYLGHVSAHRVDREGGEPFEIYTHSVVLKNVGRKPAKNVRLTHSFLPTYNIHPSIFYFNENLPSGDIDIVIPTLVPQQEVTISYLYYPPVTWQQVNGEIKSDEGLAKVLKVLIVVRHPTWLNAIVIGLMLFGMISLLYIIIEILIEFL